MQTPLRRALPNAITMVRLVLAVVFFAMLQRLDRSETAEQLAYEGSWAMAIFAVTERVKDGIACVKPDVE